MISQTERNEYVLNEVGKVYTGWSGRDWIYGQFHENALPAVMMIMKSIPDLQSNRSILSDPVRLSRALSAGVNANDGFGVLVGNWGYSYAPYTSPTSWASSIDILEQYYLSGGNSVKYGQCWVFAAVLNAALRTLGIPARPVTTLGSAHDTDNSLTIDKFYDEDMNEMDEFGSDSIWNFHSWTEAWISRPDITTRAAGGWQVVDATPQEMSDGIFQTGPASVTGIKKGDIDNNYDMHFVFSEVQAVDTRWKVDPNETMGWKRISATQIDTTVVTKAVTSDDKEDITKNYRFKDEKERRFALMNAAKRSGVELLIHDTVVTQGVEFTLSPFKLTMIGETLTGFVEMVSSLNTTVNVNTKIRIDSMFYNDVKINRIATVGQIVELAPGAKQIVSFNIPFEDYYTKLLDGCMISIAASAIVEETDQIWVRDDDIALKSPPVSINLVGEAAKEWDVNEFRVTFRNPLPIPLSECELRVHGTRQYMRLGLNNIGSGETVEYEVDISIDHIPLVFADIDCAEVTGMTGSTTVTFA
jgi:transglutaminase 1